MLISIIVKNSRKLNFNFIDVTSSPTLTIFLTISKINIKLSNEIKYMKKKFLIHFIIKIVCYIFEETKLNSVQICLMIYCFAS